MRAQRSAIARAIPAAARVVRVASVVRAAAAAAAATVATVAAVAVVVVGAATLRVNHALAAPPISLELQVGGGTALKWGGGVGTTFGAGGAVNIGDFAVGLAGATVLPDSRIQGQFGAVWMSGRWYMLSRQGLFSPYLGVAIGLTTADGFDAAAWKAAGNETLPERWASDGPALLMMGMVGLRFGHLDGMSLSIDFRSYNSSHGGLNATIAYTF